MPYGDSYFPLRYGDFIRFGNTGSYSYDNTGSLDGTFTGAGLYYIKSITTGSDYTVTGSLEIVPTLVGETTKLVVPSAADNQNYRIIRRVVSETWVTTNFNATMNIDPAVGGLLIPGDFNPHYNPIEIARNVGIVI